MRYILALIIFLTSTTATPRSSLRIEDLMHFVNPSLSSSKIKEYTKNIRLYAEVYGVDPKVVAAVMAVESGFNAGAVGPFGEVGLMQLRPKFHGNREDIADAKNNIKLGVKYLHLLEVMFEEVYGDIRYVEHYNCGPYAKPVRFKYTRHVKRYYRLLGGSDARV